MSSIPQSSGPPPDLSSLVTQVSASPSTSPSLLLSSLAAGGNSPRMAVGVNSPLLGSGFPNGTRVVKKVAPIEASPSTEVKTTAAASENSASTEQAQAQPITPAKARPADLDITAISNAVPAAAAAPVTPTAAVTDVTPAHAAAPAAETPAVDSTSKLAKFFSKLNPCVSYASQSKSIDALPQPSSSSSSAPQPATAAAAASSSPSSSQQQLQQPQASSASASAPQSVIPPAPSSQNSSIHTPVKSQLEAQLTGISIPKPPPSPNGSVRIMNPPPVDVAKANDEVVHLDDNETRGLTAGAVVNPGASYYSEGVHDSEGGEEGELEEEEHEVEEEQVMLGGLGIPFIDGVPTPLLPVLAERDKGKKCLVLDLDETLVHSTFKYVSNPDFVVNVEIEGTGFNCYVLKRPGVDEFLRRMGAVYEVVVFTASVSKYGDPVMDVLSAQLDESNNIRHRLFRESCTMHRGTYVKDLSQLGRPIESTIIIDNSPLSYIFHPQSAAPVSSWFSDLHDTELLDLAGFLEDLAGPDVNDVRSILDQSSVGV